MEAEEEAENLSWRYDEAISGRKTKGILISWCFLWSDIKYCILTRVISARGCELCNLIFWRYHFNKPWISTKNGNLQKR